MSLLTVDRFGELADCFISGELPCVVQAGPVIVSSTVAFDLDLRHRDRRGHKLRLSCVVGGVEYAVMGSWFEEGLQRLHQSLPEGVGIRACITCLFSGYSPAGHGLMGMRCHREAREGCLQVRSKGDYWVFR